MLEQKSTTWKGVTSSLEATWGQIQPQDLLNLLSDPIMVASADMVVQYINASAYKMFREMEADIRTQLPDFSADSIIGNSVDQFHVRPAKQRNIVANMTGTHQASFVVGGRTLAFAADPVFTDGGKLQMIMVRWEDRTEAVAITKQTEALVARLREMATAHELGEIDHFIALDHLEGPYRLAAEQANKMVESHITVKKQVLATVEAFGRGDFDAPFPKFTGKRVFLTNGVEELRNRFKAVVNEIARVSSAIEAGELDVETDPSQFQGEYHRIIESFSGILESLNGAFHTISAQVAQASSSVATMSKSSTELAANSQIQSASVDEVSASAEETDTQVKANAASAGQANQLVTGAAAVAEEGKEKILRMVQAMEGIRASSQDIAKIIKVIDEIAFQTNLLALNAAVEAARAGQHGRGFAVVAQEVRNLAGRSAKAARETSDLIESAGARVQAGVKIADETSHAFTSIADDIDKVRTFMREIAVASDEQARGVAQINTAMSEVAKSALATSQQADDVASSANEIVQATDRIRNEMSRFRLRSNRMGRTASGLPNLGGLSPEMLAQVQALLAGQGQARPATGPNRNPDRDERGFGGF